MAISLNNIGRGQNLKPPKVVLYGVGGIGKTSFAASAPNPIFICTEDGLGALDFERFESNAGDPTVKSWQEILECVSILYREDHEYQTLVIDTIDFAEPMLHKYTADKHNKADIEAFGYGKGYVKALDELRVLLEGLDALRNQKGMCIILLAHCSAKKFESPDTESYHRWNLKLHEKASELIHDWSDALLFANYRSNIIKEDAGFNKQRKRAVGQGERVIFTEARPAWQAKNRYRLPSELIMPIDNSWMVFQNAIAASHSATLPNEGL